MPYALWQKIAETHRRCLQSLMKPEPIANLCLFNSSEYSWNKLRFELGSTQAEAVRLQFYKKFKFSWNKT